MSVADFNNVVGISLNNGIINNVGIGTFTHVQGAMTHTAGAQDIVVTLGANPTTGNLVCVGIYSTHVTPTPATFTVTDGSGNVYTVTPKSPFTDTTVPGTVSLFYLLFAPSNASQTINVHCVQGGVTFSAWAEEFGVTGGVALFDLDVGGKGPGGTTINLPIITPTNSNSLLWSTTVCNGTITAPTAGGTLGVWTGAAGGVSSGNMSEYDLSSAAGSTVVQYTQNNTLWAGMAMSFYIAPSTLGVVSGVLKLITVNGV